MPTADEQVIVDGQRALAVSEVSGDFIYDGGATDIYCIVEKDGKAQRALKVANVGEGGGGGDLPDNVYTQDNLIAGNNISITEVQQPVIDENTVELYHCNGNMIDAIANHEWTTSANQNKYSYPEGKFAQGVRKTQAYDDAGNPLNSFDYNVPATIDFWIRRIDTSVSMGFKTVGGGDWNFYGTYVRVNNTTINYPSGITLGVNEWHHIAIVNDGTGQSTSEKYYIDGKLAGSKANNGSFGLSAIGQGGIVDEIRVSNVARWTSDFTPFSQPYQEASGNPVYQINNTQDLSSYLQNKTTANNSLLLSLKEPTSATGTNSIAITNNSSNPRNIGNYSVTIGDQSGYYNNTTSIGYQAQASSDYCTAIGNYASCIGGSGQGNSATAIGNGASANHGTAIGSGTNASAKAIVLGAGNGSSTVIATAPRAIVIGVVAATGDVCEATANEAIQLGNGSNANAKTFQVYTYQLLDGNTGLIPPERLGTGYDATKTQVLKHVNGVLTWVDEA